MHSLSIIQRVMDWDKDTIQWQPTNHQQRSKRDTRMPSRLASDYILSQMTSAVGEDPKDSKGSIGGGQLD